MAKKTFFVLFVISSSFVQVETKERTFTYGRVPSELISDMVTLMASVQRAHP